MQTITITGHLGNDAEVRGFNDDVAIGFSIAASETKSAGQKVTTWYNCTVWRKKDKAKIAEYLKKGIAVTVTGKPKLQTWVSNDGKANGRIHITVHDLALQSSLSSTAAPVAPPVPTAEEVAPPEVFNDLPF